MRLTDIAEFSQLDRLKGILTDWALWTQAYRPRLGHGSQNIFHTTGGHDFESLFSETDRLVMNSVDTCIDDLTNEQRRAIERRYLGHVHHFPIENQGYVTVLEAAYEALIPKLIKKNVIL